MLVVNSEFIMAEPTVIKTEAANDEEGSTESTAENPGKSAAFQVDMNLIPAAQMKDELDELSGLGLDVFNQEELEQGTNVFIMFCFLVTPISQFLIVLGRCTLYTPVCLQDEPTCMREDRTCVGIFNLHRG